MKSTKMISLVAVMTVAAFTAYAKADTLHYDTDATQARQYFFEFVNPETNVKTWEYTSPFKANSDNLGDSFRIFCVDKNTCTSDDFNTVLGQTYYTTALNSPSMTLYTQTQKDTLNSLFSHVYSTVFDSNGDFIDNTSIASHIYQLAVWEIIHETNDDYAVNSGSFKVSTGGTVSGGIGHVNNTFYQEAVRLANSWFDAIAGRNGVTWESIGYGTETNHELTIYVAEGGNHISQTFISVIDTDHLIENGQPSTTPEPASMLIFGLGIAGLGIARRRMMTK